MSMTKRERDVIDRIDNVLREIGSLTPPNPMDLTAKAANLPLATSAAKSLTQAISAWRCGDWDLVDEHMVDAERIVAAPSGEQRKEGQG